MRSSAKALCFSIAVFAFTSAAAFAQGAIDVDSNGADAAFSAVAKANAITGEGKTPFHLKLSFQVFDMNGKPSETGTVEEWWAGRADNRIVVTTPLLGALVNPGLEAVGGDSARRTLFLVERLLDAVNGPGGFVSTDPRYAKLVPEDRNAGGTKLECVRSEPLKHPALKANAPTACWERARGAIRLMSNEGELVARNRIGTFAGAMVSVDTQVAYGSREAITGHIDSLTGLDLSKPPLGSKSTDSTGAADAAAAAGTRVSSSVVAGQILNRVQPEYPLMARDRQVQGTVVLSARITEQGKISLLTPIASPDQLLTDAAMDAVKQWTYKPYLLNGVPTAVDTSITVNFNIGQRM